jgi:hypothetical protein
MCLVTRQRFFAVVLRDDDALLDLRPEDLRLRDPADLRDGTLAPLLRASFKPIAIACFRLVTLRPELLFRVPRFRRRIVDSTFLEADLPYFAMRKPPLRQRTHAKADPVGKFASRGTG